MKENGNAELQPAVAGQAEGAPGLQPCPNCGSGSVENYCAGCGQYAGAIRVPLRRVLSEALAGFLAFDSRIWKTLIVLVRRPGLLTLHFLAGKRARYVAPLRLYVFVSFLTFLLFALTDGGPRPTVNLSTDDTDTTAMAPVVRGDTTSADGIRIETEDSDAWLAELLQKVENDPQRVSGFFTRRLPWVFFFIMPVFASVLQLLYRRREPYYVPHLIFTLHMYAAGFLTFALATAINLMTSTEFAMMWWFIGIQVYMFLALRRVYQQKRLRTLFKQCLLVSVHSIGATIGVMLLLFFALMFA